MAACPLRVRSGSKRGNRIPRKPIGRTLNVWGEGGAGDGLRTRYLDLGKVALYQVSYSRSARGKIITRPGSRSAYARRASASKISSIWRLNVRANGNAGGTVGSYLPVS